MDNVETFDSKNKPMKFPRGLQDHLNSVMGSDKFENENMTPNATFMLGAFHTFCYLFKTESFILEEDNENK